MAERGRAGPPVAVGDVVGERYVVDALIGEGRVSMVFAARSLMTNQRVALKCLTLEATSSGRVVERFAREARAALSIKNAHVVTVHDVGTLPSGAPFLVMEYLEGRDLETWRRARGPLSVRQAAEFALHICEALAAAHARGVVHRDIQPKNLFVAERDGTFEIKLLDIGISQAALTGGSGLLGSNLPIVKTVELTGRPLYLSPEQLRSAAEVDERSDIWAIGMVLYEALTGKMAFAQPTITASCAAILQGQPQPIAEARADLPGGFARIIERCLRKDPSERFPNVAELADALMRYAPTRARAAAERAADGLRATETIDDSAASIATVFSSRPPRSESESESPPRASVAPGRATTTIIGPLPTTPAIHVPSPEPTPEPEPEPTTAPDVAAASVDDVAELVTASATSAPANVPPSRRLRILGAAALGLLAIVVLIALRGHRGPRPEPALATVPSPSASEAARAPAPSPPTAVAPPASAPSALTTALEPTPAVVAEVVAPAAPAPTAGMDAAPRTLAARPTPAMAAPTNPSDAPAPSPVVAPARDRTATPEPLAPTGRTFRREM